MNASQWKWLVDAPLTPVWRRRLELFAGVVMSGAAVVALSASIRPDPEKLAARHPMPIAAATPPPPSNLDPTTPPFAPLSPEMISAAQAGDIAAMRRAYRLGMPLDPLLAYAAGSGHKDAVLWLLVRGADIHAQEHGATSPVLAADAFPEIVALLRAQGAAEPALSDAAAANAPNALSRALAAHPDEVERTGLLAIAAGSSFGSAADKRLVFTKLLDAGADPNEALGVDTTLAAVLQACDRRSGFENTKHDCMAFVRLLLDHGARVTGDALGAALSLDDASRPAALEALLDRPIAKGVTAGALAHATSVTSEDLERIVKLGVDWAWHDGEEDAELPLRAAVQRGDRDYARTLLDAGAPVDVHFKDGTCALAEAIDGSANDDAHARIVELLVSRGANVNRRFPDGRTPLFAAAESGNIRVVNFLLAHGARPNDRILDDTALDAAEEHGNIPAARVLAAHGGVRARPAGY